MPDRKLPQNETIYIIDQSRLEDLEKILNDLQNWFLDMYSNQSIEIGKAKGE